MKKTKTKRIGPGMAAALAVVRRAPGCNKAFVAGWVGPHGSSRYGYLIVDRAIAAGLISAVRLAGKRDYALYASN